MPDRFPSPFNRPQEKSPHTVDKAEVHEEFGNPESVDFSKMLGESNVLFISDSHTSFTNKNAFIQSLDALKTKGVTDIALEMFPAGFDSNDLEAAKKYLQEHWEKQPGIPEKYLEILTHAKGLGLRVWGIGISSEEYRSKSVSDTFQRKNKQWANLIDQKIKENPGAKVVVHHGAAHAGYYPARDRANNFLEDMGYKPVVANMLVIEGKSSAYTDEARKMELLAQRNPDERFMVRLSTDRRPADYIVYLGHEEAKKDSDGK